MKKERQSALFLYVTLIKEKYPNHAAPVGARRAVPCSSEGALNIVRESYKICASGRGAALPRPSCKQCARIYGEGMSQ